MRIGVPATFFAVVIASVCVFKTTAFAQQVGDSVLFRNVLEIPGHYINDHSLLYVRGTWHLYFILGDVADPKDSVRWYRAGNEVTIGHATSLDLVTWKLEAPALRTGPPGSLDAGHVYAPNIVHRDGVYYMFYTGVAVTFFGGEHLMLATSTDLYNWTRYGTEPMVEPGFSWASYLPNVYRPPIGGPISSRDPFVFQDDKHGYILYYVARLKADPKRPSTDQEFSCVAAATSTDLINWVDKGPVLTRRMIGFDQFRYAHTESPCVVKRGDLYYLFWKGGSGTRYVISQNPLDFEDRNEYGLVSSHASKVFQFGDRWFITSCSRQINDVTHSYSDRTRGLFLAEMIWGDFHPVVTSLREMPPVEMLATPPVSLSPRVVISGEKTFIYVPTQPKSPVLVEITNAQGVIVQQQADAIVQANSSSAIRVMVATAGLRAGTYRVSIAGIANVFELIVQ